MCRTGPCPCLSSRIDPAWPVNPKKGIHVIECDPDGVGRCTCPRELLPAPQVDGYEGWNFETLLGVWGPSLLGAGVTAIDSWQHGVAVACFSWLTALLVAVNRSRSRIRR